MKRFFLTLLAVVLFVATSTAGFASTGFYGGFYNKGDRSDDAPLTMPMPDNGMY